ncbi:MAG: DNA adenine methylase [Bacteroidetes bacterium]|nr:DNA adenine methylase [Bacteroidota bacterium]
MKTPISYYGGKQKLAATILKLIPKHNLYCEPFIGGAAIFFAKEPSNLEVINDVNKELVNFYRTVQNDYVGLEKEIKITLHSRDLHRKANVIYTNPDMFSEIKRAWSVWVLSTQSFAAMLDGSWGYDVGKNTTTKKISNKRESFTEDYAIRLQNVQIECTDALRIIRARDTKEAFFYCDPPYYNSDMGHYDGYTIEDFEGLLKCLSAVEGKFLLSSYPSPILKKYVKLHGWHQVEIEQTVSVGSNSPKPRKCKIEVLTSNYPIK